MNTKDDDKDAARRRARAVEMQASHIAKIFISTNQHGMLYTGIFNLFMFYFVYISFCTLSLLLSVVSVQFFDHRIMNCNLFVFAVYLWLSHQLNLKQTLLSDSADMCGFSKALLAIRKFWTDKYGRHDPGDDGERFFTVRYKYPTLKVLL